MATIKQRIDNVTENVTDGKNIIASAITELGVSATSAETFNSLANKLLSTKGVEILVLKSVDLINPERTSNITATGNDLEVLNKIMEYSLNGTPYILLYNGYSTSASGIIYSLVMSALNLKSTTLTTLNYEMEGKSYNITCNNISGDNYIMSAPKIL